MNNLTSNLDMRTPIEIALDIDSEGMTTAKKLYAFLELAPQNYARWCDTNIVKNEFADENIDYWAFSINGEWGGQATTDYKLTSHFAKKLCQKGNGEKAEQAREYFTTVEERVKQIAIDRQQLSPQLQMFGQLFDAMAKNEIEQKKQAEQIKAIEQTVSNIKEVMTAPIGDWRSEINARVREISLKSDIDYQTMFSQMYGELEQTAHCSLKRLCENKKARMEKAGNTKTAIKNETTKIAVIENDCKLKAIFENIVRRYAMKYCA